MQRHAAALVLQLKGCAPGFARRLAQEEAPPRPACLAEGGGRGSTQHSTCSTCSLLNRAMHAMPYCTGRTALSQSPAKRCCRPTDDGVLPSLPRKGIEQLMLVMLAAGALLAWDG